MIVKTFVVILTLSVTLICDATGTSYSNVYVESEVVPRRYYQYGTPYYTSVANSKLSQINALPPVPGYVAPCGPPCVYPAQTVATVTAVNPSPNVLTYNAPAPNVPVVVTPTKEEATAYEYSYVVYDDSTGDHKAQRELSDGTVVRGEYSFLQPDGYVREVQYVADDVSGFNAVVKNFLPAVVERKKHVESKDMKHSTPPCHETKSESLKVIESSTESTESTETSKESVTKEVTEKSKETSEEEHKQKFAEEEPEIEQSQEKPGDGSEEKQSDESQKSSKENSGEKSVEESKKELSKESKEKSESEETKEDLKEESRNMHSKESGENKESKETSKEESAEKDKKVQDLLKPDQETVVSYNDIIRCIQAAIKNNIGVPAAIRNEPSPLTYIILNKPC